MSGPLLLDLLSHWFSHPPDRVSGRLDGGDLNDVFRVDYGADSYALRLHAATSTRGMVEAELRVVAQFADRVPEVSAPIRTCSGQLLAEQSGRVASLSRFIEGDRPDRAVPQHRRAAAQLLARLHAVAREIGPFPERPGYPSISKLDWFANRWWTWSDVNRYLAECSNCEQMGTAIGRLRETLARALDEIPSTVASLGYLELPQLQTHGDFCPGNMRMQEDRIVGLFDWDETRVEWRASEVAYASWEFCQLRRGHLDLDAARSFVDVYLLSGGQLTVAERRLLMVLMRAHILWGLLYGLGEAQREVDSARGLDTDWAYTLDEACALERLRDVTLA